MGKPRRPCDNSRLSSSEFIEVLEYQWMDGSTTLKTPCNNPPVALNYQNLLALDYNVFLVEYYLS